MLQKADNREWVKTGKAPRAYQLRGSDGRTVAEVVNDGPRWLWYRQTSFAQDGIGPASGEAETLKEATRMAAMGL